MVCRVVHQLLATTKLKTPDVPQPWKTIAHFTHLVLAHFVLYVEEIPGGHFHKYDSRGAYDLGKLSKVAYPVVDPMRLVMTQNRCWRDLSPSNLISTAASD